MATTIIFIQIGEKVNMQRILTLAMLTKHYIRRRCDYYYIYISGYEGKVLKEERQGNVRIIAEYIPANPVENCIFWIKEVEVLDVPYLNYADQNIK